MLPCFTSSYESLLDRGANGGLAGSDVRILSKSLRKCNVTSINHHVMQDLDIVQCAVLLNTKHGIVNFMINNCAYSAQGHTIHSSGQVEWSNNNRILSNNQILVSCSHMTCYLHNLHYISIYIFY